VLSSCYFSYFVFNIKQHIIYASVKGAHYSYLAVFNLILIFRTIVTFEKKYFYFMTTFSFVFLINKTPIKRYKTRSDTKVLKVDC